MAQKAHPNILRSTTGSYDSCTYWDEPKLYHTTSMLHRVFESCCLSTNHYLNNIKINQSQGQLTLNIELLHLHYRSKRKFVSRRHKDNKAKSQIYSWPIMACRLQTATHVIQQFTGVKKVTLDVTRKKVYTRSIPKTARKELGFFNKSFNRARYDYARHGMQLMHLLVNNKASAETLVRFVQDNVCSRQRRKRHYQFLGYIKQTLRALEPYKRIKGVKIQIKGRFTHKAKSRSRTWTYQMGSVPLSQLNKDIQAAYAQTQTAYGSVGLKIWICP